MTPILEGIIKDGFNRHTRKVFYSLDDNVLLCHTFDGCFFTIAEDIATKADAYRLLSSRDSVMDVWYLWKERQVQLIKQFNK